MVMTIMAKIIMMLLFTSSEYSASPAVNASSTQASTLDCSLALHFNLESSDPLHCAAHLDLSSPTLAPRLVKVCASPTESGAVPVSWSSEDGVSLLVDLFCEICNVCSVSWSELSTYGAI